MRDREGAGFWRRTLAAVGGVLLRGIQGKSGNGYLRRFAGDGEYWERAIAAQRGWPGEGPEGTEPHPSVSPSGAASSERPNGQDDVGRPGEREPVYGWTKRQFDDYLARNPGFRSAYESEAALQERGEPARSRRERVAVLRAAPAENRP